MRKTMLPLLLLAAALPAHAQTPPPLSDSVETVYSDAQREVDESLAARAVNGVLTTADTSEDQYARWKQPVCFNVYGLSPLAKYQVEKRMKAIAAQVGAPVDRAEDCTPTILIAFTTDQNATLQSIAEVRPWLLPGLGMIRNITRETMPIQAWYAIAVKGATGRSTLVYNGYDYEPQVTLVSQFSRLSSGFETEIAAATLVVDSRAIMGMNLETLADHFALAALAQTRPTTRCRDFESIANLMKGCDPSLTPDGISKIDLALLTGLYRTPDDTLQRVQRIRIMGNMRRTLESQTTSKDVPMQ